MLIDNLYPIYGLYLQSSDSVVPSALSLLLI